MTFRPAVVLCECFVFPKPAEYRRPFHPAIVADGFARPVSNGIALRRISSRLGPLHPTFWGHTQVIYPL